MRAFMCEKRSGTGRLAIVAVGASAFFLSLVFFFFFFPRLNFYKIYSEGKKGH